MSKSEDKRLYESLSHVTLRVCKKLSFQYQLSVRVVCSFGILQGTSSWTHPCSEKPTKPSMIIFGPVHDKTNINDLCDQPRLRSVWEPGQPRLISLRWTPEVAVGPTERTARTDQTGQMLSLIWVFAGPPDILLVLLCCESFYLVSLADKSWLIITGSCNSRYWQYQN